MPSLQSLYEAQSGLRNFYPLTGAPFITTPRADMHDYTAQAAHMVVRGTTLTTAYIRPGVTTGFFTGDTVANFAGVANTHLRLPGAVSAHFSGRNRFSVAFRFRVTSLSAQQRVFFVSLNTSGAQLCLATIETSGAITVQTQASLGDGRNVTSAASVVAINTDYQCLITMDLSTDRLRCYLNNTLVIDDGNGWTGTTFTVSVNDDYHGIGSTGTGTLPLQGKIGYMAFFDTDVGAAQAGFVAATSGLGFKDATIGTPLSNLANGTYRLRVYDSADKNNITRIVWNGNITLTAGTSSTVVESSVPNGNLAYCVLTSQSASQTDEGANTFAGPLVLNHV